MDMYSYIRRLCDKGENTEVEFKSAHGGVPNSFWETYSAFGNTSGGIIVLGIKEKNHKFFPDNLTAEQVDKYKKQYWDDVHNKNKVNYCLTVDEDVSVEEFEGSFILVARVPRAVFSKRPIYLTQNPFGHTYVRRHEGDYFVDDDEARRMFAYSNVKDYPLDAKIFSYFSLEKDLDETTIRQYRQLYNNKHEGHPWTELSNLEFMKKIGGYVVNSETGEKGFTLAAILMFGLEETILSVLPHYYVDFREKLNNDPEQVELTLFLGSSTTKTTTTTSKTTTKEQILELIKANPSATMNEIAEKIGLTKDGVYYHIKQMLGKKLVHIGPTNGGHWEILK